MKQLFLFVLLVGSSSVQSMEQAWEHLDLWWGEASSHRTWENFYRSPAWHAYLKILACFQGSHSE